MCRGGEGHFLVPLRATWVEMTLGGMWTGHLCRFCLLLLLQCFFLSGVAELGGVFSVTQFLVITLLCLIVLFCSLVLILVDVFLFTVFSGWQPKVFFICQTWLVAGCSCTPPTPVFHPVLFYHRLYCTQARFRTWVPSVDFQQLKKAENFFFSCLVKLTTHL